VDPHNDIYAIINFAVVGNVYNEKKGAVYCIFAAHCPQTGWITDMGSDSAGKLISNNVLFFGLNGNQLSYKNKCFQLLYQGKNLNVNLSLQPLTSILPLKNYIPFGKGWMDWIILPRLFANGSMENNGITYTFNNALCYHDHNRGYWLWEENIGWNWGFCIQSMQHSQIPSLSGYSIIFDSYLGHHRNIHGNNLILIWKATKLFKIFHWQEISLGYSDIKFRGKIEKFPAVMDSLYQSTTLRPPEEIYIRAHSGSDKISIRFIAEECLQILIPKENAQSLRELNEIIGICEVKGKINGEIIHFKEKTFMEYLAK
jgi:hypothetical protein